MDPQTRGVPALRPLQLLGPRGPPGADPTFLAFLGFGAHRAGVASGWADLPRDLYSGRVPNRPLQPRCPKHYGAEEEGNSPKSLAAALEGRPGAGISRGKLCRVTTRVSAPRPLRERRPGAGRTQVGAAVQAGRGRGGRKAGTGGPARGGSAERLAGSDPCAP